MKVNGQHERSWWECWNLWILLGPVILIIVGGLIWYRLGILACC